VQPGALPVYLTLSMGGVQHCNKAVAGSRFALSLKTSQEMSYFWGGPASPLVEIKLLPVSTKPICATIVNADKTLDNIPPNMREKLEQKIEEFKKHLTSPEAEWESFMDTKGVKGIRRFEEGKELAVIRSEAVLPFHIVDVFAFVDDVKSAPILDNIVSHSHILKRFSSHSWAGCVTLHGVSVACAALPNNVNSPAAP
jgi:hypothetical protein